MKHLAPFILILGSFLGFALTGSSQCPACTVDPDCSSADGFPIICPETLPPGTTGLYYEQTLTFFMPEEVVDPGSGITASLISVTVTSISDVPLGLQVELDDSDNVYYPAQGQTTGCATICGEPMLAGVYEMIISISAIASAFGIEQVVNESFSYTVIIDAGAGGTGSFTYFPASGCGSLIADFEANLSGTANQTTTYSWDFGNGMTSSNAVETGVVYNQPGSYTVTLQTTISELVLFNVTLNSTGGGGWDDFFGPPDPYFTLTDASGTTVYTSSTSDDSNSASWSNLGIVLSNPPYTISFYDEDLFDGDDDLGSTSFTPVQQGAMPLTAGPSNAVLNIVSETVVNVTDSIVVVVYDFPEVGIFQVSDNVLSCTNPMLSVYSWISGDSVLTSGSNYEFSPEASGWYQVEGTSPFGCSSVSDSILFCSPNASMELQLITENLDPLSLESEAGWPFYIWSQNGVVLDTLSGAEGAFYFPAESSWYSVASEDSLGCPVSSDSLLVCWPLDSIFIIQTEEGNLIVDQSYTSYLWYADGVNLLDETDSLLINPGPGIYTVAVSDFDYCPYEISEEWTYVSVGEYRAEKEALVYPNPFNEILNIEAPSNGVVWDVRLFDLNGKQVAVKAHIRTPYRWNLANLPPGVYLLHMTETKAPSKSLPPIRVLKDGF